MDEIRRDSPKPPTTARVQNNRVRVSSSSFESSFELLQDVTDEILYGIISRLICI